MWWPPSIPGSVECVVIVHQRPPLSERHAALCCGQSVRWQAGGQAYELVCLTGKYT